MWPRSLRRRLVLTMAVGGIAILSVVALLSQRAMTREFGVFLERELPQFMEEGPDLARYAPELMAAWGPGWDHLQVQRCLNRIEADLGAEYRLTFVSLDGGDDVVLDQLAHPTAVPNGAGRRNAERVEQYVLIEKPSGEITRVDAGHLSTRGLPELRLVDERGVDVGLLMAIPNLTASGSEMEERFAGSLSQWLLLTALVAALIGVWMVSAVAKRIVGPVEALTSAARGMARGELEQRIDVRSGDEIGALATAFNHMAESLEQGERNRRNMISDTAHELRTPLTNVLCQIEGLQDGLIQPDGGTFASLHEEIVHLGKLVDDLQMLSLAESGALRMELRELDLRSEVARCLSTIVPRGDQPILHNRVSPGTRVLADSMRLHQVLGNLIANATTNTAGDGQVAIHCRCLDEHVEVSVLDSGAGVGPQDLPHVFERLYRTDPSRSRRTGGVGLGLAIVKGLVEAQGGRVGVESAHGAGSRFWFTLPKA